MTASGEQDEFVKPAPAAATVRVVHVTAIGSTAKMFLVEHFRRLTAGGFDVTLVCSDSADARSAAETGQVRYAPVTIRQGVSPLADMKSLWRLWRLFRRIRPGIVHAHMSKAGLIAMLAARLAGVPIRIYHNHGMAFLSLGGFRRRLLRTVEVVSCALASEVIYCGESTMREAVDSGACRRSKATVLGPGTICGIDTDRFDPQAVASRGLALRREAGFDETDRLVGFVGRIVQHKGIRTLLEAWLLLPGDIRRRTHLCIFGLYDDPDMQALVETAADEPGLNVRYMGFSDEMPAWYSAMTLLVQASWHEGFPYSIMEAACCGVPSVATCASGTVDAVIDEQTGLLVPLKDPRAMADAIERLMMDDDLRRRLGLAARRRILEHFKQDQICPLLVQEYRRLLHEICGRST